MSSAHTKAPDATKQPAAQASGPCACQKGAQKIYRKSPPGYAWSQNAPRFDFGRTGVFVPVVQPKLEVSSPGDALEREADAIAARVSSGSPAVQRACDACAKQPGDEDEEGRRVLRKPSAGAEPSSTSVGSEPLAHALSQAHGSGSPLSTPVRADMERSFGFDFRHVRVHTDERAHGLSEALGATAFTYGSDIFFRRGMLEPGSSGGKHLLAHELSHVVQQNEGRVARMIQRTTHSGTPTNCHNWKIPLPPWIAGSIAHGQISTSLGIYPQAIPRATKVAMLVPNPPAWTPWGFADLWQRGAAGANIAEIKSTSAGDAIARAESLHYIARHLQWLGRAPHTDPADLIYFAGAMGGSLLPAGPLNLSSRTGTDLNLGMFWGDPMKQLHVEGDSTGSVVYWCTGAGLPFSPVWYPAFRALIRAIRDMLDSARRSLQEILDGVLAAASTVIAWIQGIVSDIVTWGLEHSRIIAFLALLLILIVGLVVLILSALGEAPSGGTSTVPLLGSLAAIGASVSGLLILIGVSSPNLPAASDNMARALRPDEANAVASAAEYEQGTGNPDNWSTTQAQATAARPDIQGQFIAALAPIRDPMALFERVISSVRSIPPGGVDQLINGADLLEQHGDTATAGFIRQSARSAGLLA